MKRISFWILLLVIFLPRAWSAPTSYRLTHPLTWMHSLPAGEMPGWNSRVWAEFDFSVSNIWNAPLSVYNHSNKKVLSYQADFEQTSLVFEAGFALNSFIGFSVEMPYAHRSGGVMDQFIDNFHVVIGSERFNRPQFAKNRSIFRISSEGEDKLTNESVNGVGNVKYKLKFWWLKWMGKKEGSCNCGFSNSVQMKVPVASEDKGLTSGEIDYSLLWHLGVPLFDASALWLTSAMTYVEKSPLFEDWPRRKWLQMYEASLDLALTDSWGLLFQVRMESPFMHKQDLSIIDDETSPKQLVRNRVASGWNSLVHWRGSEAMGFRYRPDGVSQMNFLFIEDWALGRYDNRGDRVYVNNAPDVVFTIQYSYGF